VQTPISVGNHVYLRPLEGDRDIARQRVSEALDIPNFLSFLFFTTVSLHHDTRSWFSRHFTVILLVNICEVLFTTSRGYALNELEDRTFPDEGALRHAVEKRARRSLSDAEWTAIAPDWSAPYGDGDVTELVNSARDSIPAHSKRSPDDNARLGRRAYTQRVALQARKMIEAF
jgi:hypothetical protein